MLELQNDEGARLAWAQTWKQQEHGGHQLLAVPRLRLAQAPALDLMSGLGYAQVFANCHVVLDGVAVKRGFVVLHASFDLFRSGKADVVDFAGVLVDPAQKLSGTAEMIAATSQMLRG